MSTRVYLINHTHWDREWFLTSAYTSQWIPNLIDRILELKEKNKDYKFLLDGQTLVIKDLLDIAPEYEKKIFDLVKNGNLILGPYYCQPDWRLVGGETLIRNMFWGLHDIRKFGSDENVGWLVDNFGHISQAPQLHQLFNIGSAYIWRGAPKLTPYFLWRSPDASQLFTINLLAGYRNLYGVTQVPKVAVDRLTTEVYKLKPFYPTNDIPLFDGYDLELNPEDAFTYYKNEISDISEDIELHQTSAGEFAEEIYPKLDNLPIVEGELNSGKFSAIFPGTLSARTYLKIMNHDCERILYKICEPLAVIACIKGREYCADQFEIWERSLLENEVHDCICGVSIDQVHEKMEISYVDLYQAFLQDIKKSLDYILDDFQHGKYVVSTNPFDYEGWHAVDDSVYHIQTKGVGVWSVTDQEKIDYPYQQIKTFHWENDHYCADVTADGIVHIGNAVLGRFMVFEECGDTYSDEIGEYWGSCKLDGPIVVEKKNDNYCQIKYDCSAQRGKVVIKAEVRLIFDQTEILRWQIDLDTRGSDFRLDLVFETNHKGKVYAGMPFDVVERPNLDTDLLPCQLEGGLSKILYGQREINRVKTFPFHDFVGLSDGISSVLIFSRGIRAYQVEENGKISLPLRRSIEWLTKPNLKNRIGDAGPFMYVPDARCERYVRHEIGVSLVDVGINDLTVQKLNAAFSNPPIIVNKVGHGQKKQWRLIKEDLPMSNIQIVGGNILARFYNPNLKKKSLHKQYWKTDIWGEEKTRCTEIGGKQIVNLLINESLSPMKEISRENRNTLIDFPSWRVGENQACPEKRIIDKLRNKVAQIEKKLKKIEDQINNNDSQNHTLRHQYYILKRELYEMRLTVCLNEKKLKLEKEPYRDILYKPDPELADLGSELNQHRILRRIYDYVSTL